MICLFFGFLSYFQYFKLKDLYFFCFSDTIATRGDFFMDKKYHISYVYLSNPLKYGNTFLLHLGRLHCTPGYVVDMHVHPELFELTIVTNGEGIITTNDIPTNVSEGDIYLSYPGDFHEIISSAEKPLKYDFFSFNSKDPEIKDELQRIVSTYSCDQRVFRDARINSAISNAIAEFSSKHKYHDKILSSVFEQIIYYILRSFDSESLPDKGNHITSQDELCFQIMNYIDTHIYSIKNLSELSDEFSYNYSYLSDIFKKNTGNTIVKYYQSRRLEAAKLLISEERRKIIEIAEMLNYSSLYSFSKAFKKKYGVSPKHYLHLKKTQN